MVAVRAPVAEELNHLHFARQSGCNRFGQNGVIFASLGFVGGAGCDGGQAREKWQEHGQAAGQAEVASIHGWIHQGVV